MVCQNDESDALMMTSTFLPAAAPPLPPPPPPDSPPDARPATTPTTPAISAMTATSDSENFSRVFLSPMLPLSPGPSSPARRERTFSRCDDRTPRFERCQENIRFWPRHSLH